MLSSARPPALLRCTTPASCSPEPLDEAVDAERAVRTRGMTREDSSPSPGKRVHASCRSEEVQWSNRPAHDSPSWLPHQPAQTQVGRRDLRLGKDRRTITKDEAQRSQTGLHDRNDDRSRVQHRANSEPGRRSCRHIQSTANCDQGGRQTRDTTSWVRARQSTEPLRRDVNPPSRRFFSSLLESIR